MKPNRAPRRPWPLLLCLAHAALALGCGAPTETIIYVHDDLAGTTPASMADLSAAHADLSNPGPCGVCGDGGACDVDLGRCRGCLTDAECPNPKLPFCDAQSGRCGACSPEADRCPQGMACILVNGVLGCAPGCKTDGECRTGDGGSSTSACCDGACVDTATSIANCGGCGTSCGNAPDAACCRSSCAHTRTDVKACGGCGNLCNPQNSIALCKVGSCGYSACLMGYGDCDGNALNGCEISLTSDIRNCGACGHACMVANATPLCVGGSCLVSSCNMGFRDCDGDPATGCEVDTVHDEKNCGACGLSCAKLPHATANCMNGGCAIGSCETGFGNCNQVDGDGCESILVSDPMNCGGCGHVCPAAPNVTTTCTMGVCGTAGCVPGFGDCNKNLADGCEAKLATDVNNCGACSTQCKGMGQNAVAACVNGACALTCNNGFGDCDNNPVNGCEANLGSDAGNCGKCGAPCLQGQSCVAGVCAQYGDWLTGTPCANSVCGNCDPAGNGYHYRGTFNGFQCWWHTHNQDWNTTTSTNIYQLAKHFGLNPATGRETWCDAFANTPAPLNYPVNNNNYDDINNVGAWGCCGGWPSSGGWVCLQ